MRPRTRIAILFAVMAALLWGCQDETGIVEKPPEWDDPNDPVICVGDPDTSIVCKKASEFWDCEVMPNGDVKCNHDEKQSPDGTNDWTCEVKDGKIVCTSTNPDAKGGADWVCESDGNGTTCEKEAPVPPGGGDYTCGYVDSEFNWSCTGKGVPKPPTTPPTTTPPEPGQPPPGGGTRDCFGSTEPPSVGTAPPGAWAVIITKKVLFKGQPALYVRVTFNKAFVDNTYGANASVYLNKKGGAKGHSFHDLEESDKAEVFFNDSTGALMAHYVIDYISASSSAPSGYACLGVTGGDGQVMKGNASDVLATQSSLAVNFNVFNYVLTTDSPKTDDKYTPDPQYPKWIFDVWYEAYIKWSAFGANGPGKVYITGIHASPSRLAQNSFEVFPEPCP